MEWVIIILVVVAIGVLISRSNKKAREKILAKYNFSSQERELFLSKKLWVGMPADALYTILGPGEQNKTQSARGEKIQHVYKNSDDYRYVYTENGIVTSWQNGR